MASGPQWRGRRCRRQVVGHVALAWLIAAPLLGQTHESSTRNPHAAQPERPTVSTPASTTAPGWVEIEAGLEVDRYRGRELGGLGPIAIKLGLAPRWQLAVQDAVVHAPGSPATAVGDAALALKWRLAEHLPALGDVAVASAIKLPTGSVANGAGTGTSDVSVSLIDSARLGQVAIDVNYGVTLRTGDGRTVPRHASVWAVAASGPLHGRVGWMSELFGFPKTSGPAGAESIVGVIEGATFEVREWLVLDLGVAVPIAGPQPRALFAGAVYNVGPLHAR